jgi:hypothetical protein
MKREVTIKRVEDIIKSYKEDESKSKYYKELKKSFKEFESMQVHTRNIDKLYLKHMNDLCDYLEEKRHFISLTFYMIIVLLLTICFTAFTGYRYYKIRNELLPKIVESNTNVTLEVSYNNMHNFEVQVLDTEESYLNLKYLTMDIKAKGDNKDIQYNVYLIPVNYDKESIQLDAFKLNMGDQKIVTLSNDELIDGKIRVYTGKMNTNDIKSHDIRMWIDNNSDQEYVNKNFKFQIYVDGYII